jgi:hypothetical protein
MPDPMAGKIKSDRALSNAEYDQCRVRPRSETSCLRAVSSVVPQVLAASNSLDGARTEVRLVGAGAPIQRPSAAGILLSFFPSGIKGMGSDIVAVHRLRGPHSKFHYGIPTSSPVCMGRRRYSRRVPGTGRYRSDPWRCIDLSRVRSNAMWAPFRRPFRGVPLQGHSVEQNSDRDFGKEGKT